MIGFEWHIVTVILLLCLSFMGFSQSLDSLDVNAALPATDTIEFRHQETLDSLQASAARAYASMKQAYDSVAGVAGIAEQRTRKQIDSLTALGLPTYQFSARLDSIGRWKNTRLDSIADRFAAVRSGVQEKIKSLDLPPELTGHADAIVSQANKLDLSLLPAEFSGINDPVTHSLSLSGLSDPRANDINLPLLENPVSNQPLPQIPDMNLSTGNIGDLADPLAPVQQQVAGVTPAIPADAGEAAAMLEERAASLPAATGVTEQLDAAEGLNPVPVAGDPEATKEKLIEDTRKVAVNHFAGKEEQLRQAMDKLAALKKKYGSIESLANLPRRVPNAMSGKPFVERLVPGLALQVGRNDHWLLDANLYLGYRFTGRITTGAGWNHRIAYNAGANTFNSRPVIYGPRVYGEYGIGKGFSTRLELEYMNTYVPAPFASNPDNPEAREWVFGVMTGMKKSYTITRRLKGTVMLLYNLYNPHHRSPYKNRLNGRFGVEWRIKANANRND